MSIILLKSSDSDKKNDKYFNFLLKAQEQNDHIKEIDLINLLDFSYINVERLKESLDKCFSSDFYSCIIITSKQTVNAISNIDKIELNPNKAAKLVVYCVGEESAAQFSCMMESKFPYLREFYEFRATIDQKKKQNASELAQMIIDDVSNAKFSSHQFRAFFPCSSIRLDTLPLFFQEKRLDYDELFVYETKQSASGVEELNERFLKFFKTGKEKEILVFFSPSIVEIFFENCLKSEHGRKYESSNLVYFVSIGPSTTKKLKEFISDFEIFQWKEILEMEQVSPQSLLDDVQRIL